MYTTKTAIFSPDRKYRYALYRIWSPEIKPVLFVGLNPSTADEDADDPTVRRCIRYALSWRYGGIIMANLFAFRSTSPEYMKRRADPVGPENDKWLKELSQEAGITIAAWGTNGNHKERDKEVIPLLQNLHCLGLTKAGMPRHPLYMPKKCHPLKWEPCP